LEDLGFDLFDVGVDLVKGAGWLVAVEDAGEGDLVAEFGLGVVGPGVGGVWEDFGLEVVVDAVGEDVDGAVVGLVGVGEGDGLLPAQVRVGLRSAFGVAEDFDQRSEALSKLAAEAEHYYRSRTGDT
jgi:hypothetical protein